MALADQAVQRLKAAQDNAANKARKALETVGHELRDKLAEGLAARGVDAQVIYLDTITGTHPVQKHNRGGFGGTYLAHVEHTLHRIRVDDVVIVGTDVKDSEFGVERPCARCRRPAYSTNYTSDLTSEVKLDVPDNDYSSLKQTNWRFTCWLGRLLSQDTLCWDCEADLSDRCHSCNRNYTTPPVDWAIAPL